MGAFAIGEKGCGSWSLVWIATLLLGKIRVFVYYYYFWVFEKEFSSLFNILFVLVMMVVVSRQVMGGVGTIQVP